MEVVRPVDRSAPKILKIIKPNETFTRAAPQNNNCELKLVRPYEPKVHVNGNGNLLLSKPNFIIMNKTHIKANPGMKLQKIVDPIEQRQKLQPSIPLLDAKGLKIKKKMVNTEMKQKVDGIKKVLLVKSPSGFIDKMITKSDLDIETKEIEKPADQKPKLQVTPALTTCVNNVNEMLLIKASSDMTHKALEQSCCNLKRQEAATDENTVEARRQQEPLHSKQLNTTAHQRRQRFRHSRRPPAPVHLSDNSINVIQCEMAENGKAMLSINGILISTMLSKKKKGKTHDMGNATLTRYKVFQCKLCSAKYLTLKNLNIHNRQHDSGDMVVCERCGIVFAGADPFQLHKCEYKSKAIFKCKLCNSRFETPLKYSEHVCRTRASTKAFSCETCRASYTSLLKYKRHKLTHADRSLFCCKICNAIFKTSRQFLDHSRSHTGEKPFTCDTCLDTFKSQYCLNRHREVHKGVELHYCSICRAAFRNVLGLARHNRTHTDHQSNVCIKCNARFATTDELVQHSVVHDGEKPYMCYICNATFYFAHNLDQHLRLSDCASKIKKK